MFNWMLDVEKFLENMLTSPGLWKKGTTKTLCGSVDWLLGWQGVGQVPAGAVWPTVCENAVWGQVSEITFSC